MKEIQLTRGLVALVDKEDFEWLSKWKWHAARTGSIFYARRDEMRNGIKLRIYMHRVICAATAAEYVDHEDHNTLNNQRSNLRRGTQSLNMGNSILPKHNTSGFKGVAWDKSKAKWIAYRSERQNGKSSFKFLGRFSTRREAALAYDVSALQKYGSFALTNQKLGLL